MFFCNEIALIKATSGNSYILGFFVTGDAFELIIFFLLACRYKTMNRQCDLLLSLGVHRLYFFSFGGYLFLTKKSSSEPKVPAGSNFTHSTSWFVEYIMSQIISLQFYMATKEKNRTSDLNPCIVYTKVNVLGRDYLTAEERFVCIIETVVD